MITTVSSVVKLLTFDIFSTIYNIVHILSSPSDCLHFENPRLWRKLTWTVGIGGKLWGCLVWADNSQLYETKGCIRHSNTEANVIQLTLGPTSPSTSYQFFYQMEMVRFVCYKTFKFFLLISMVFSQLNSSP